MYNFYLLEQRFYSFSIMNLLYPLEITMQLVIYSFYGKFDEFLDKATFPSHFLLDYSLHSIKIFIINNKLKHLK